MHPILFEIGPVKIYSYGVMVALAFITAALLASRDARKNNLPYEKIMDVSLYIILFGIIGARLLHVLIEFDYYSNNPLEIIMINKGGLAFQGGLIFGIVAGFICIRSYALPLWETADIFAPYLALAQSIGRIGCYLNGCCYGVENIPVQLYLSISFLIIYGLLRVISRLKHFDGAIIILYLMLFSLASFFMDFLRGDLACVFMNLKLSQIINAAIFIFSTVLLTVRWKTTNSR